MKICAMYMIPVIETSCMLDVDCNEVKRIVRIVSSKDYVDCNLRMKKGGSGHGYLVS